MRLRGTYLLLLATLLGAVGLSSGAAWVGLGRLEDAHRDLVERDLRRILSLTSVRRHFRNELVLREDLERTRPSGAHEETLRQLTQTRHERRVLLRELRTLDLPGPAQALAELEALDTLDDLRSDTRRSWESDIAALLAASEAELVAGSRLAAETGATGRRHLAAVTAFALLAGIGLGLTLLRRIAQTTRALASSESRLRDVVASAPSALLILSPARAVEFLSPQSAQVLGHPAAALATDPACWVDLTDRERLGESFSQACRGTPLASLAVRGHRADGTAFSAMVGTAVTRSPEGTVAGVVWQVQDVTEARAAAQTRAKLEQQLGQAQKLEAIGQLAGGVAHDFNNLLTAINGNTELVQEQLPAGSEARQMLEEVVEAGQRAATLTRQLLTFSRKQVISPRPVVLNEILLGMQRMLQRLLGEKVDVEWKTAADLGTCLADPGQVEQILLNLSINARDAMPGGGTIFVETSNAEVDEDLSRTSGTPAGRYVQLSVSDTGCGMTPEVRARIFEPFFTTKATGQGTGLGLAMVYGAVKQHQGAISVYSEPGEGTTFRILLPRTDETAATPSEALPADDPRGTEQILLVEDDESVRRFAALALGRRGYRVAEAGSAEAALARILEGSLRPDLLVTDLILPKLNGRELVELLAQHGITLPVLYTSGYSDQLVTSSGILQPGIDLLAKPYDARSLSRRVRAALDKPRG